MSTKKLLDFLEAVFPLTETQCSPEAERIKTMIAAAQKIRDCMIEMQSLNSRHQTAMIRFDDGEKALAAMREFDEAADPSGTSATLNDGKTEKGEPSVKKKRFKSWLDRHMEAPVRRALNREIAAEAGIAARLSDEQVEKLIAYLERDHENNVIWPYHLETTLGLHFGSVSKFMGFFEECGESFETWTFPEHKRIFEEQGKKGILQPADFRGEIEDDEDYMIVPVSMLSVHQAFRHKEFVNTYLPVKRDDDE